MIDDKKIEEAAFDYNDGELTNDKLIRAAFIYMVLNGCKKSS